MSVLDRIRRWAEDPDPELSHDATGDVTSLELRDAAVALLLEAAYGDTYLAEEERAALRAGIAREFGVSELEAAAFMDSALGARPPIRKLQDLTRGVRDGYDDEQKVALLALLWQVVRADQTITEWEQTFADHVAQAVGLTPTEWKRAKALAEAED